MTTQKWPKNNFNSLREPSAARLAAQAMVSGHKTEHETSDELPVDSSDVDITSNSDLVAPGEINDQANEIPTEATETNHVPKPKPRSKPKPKPKPRPVSKPPPKLTSENNDDSRPSSSTSKSKPPGELTKTDHKLKRSNKPRTFQCPQCPTKCDSQAAMNNHYCTTHPPVKCPECNDTFSTPNTLARHQYTHGKLNKVCRDCDKKFAFAHKLKIHWYGHRRYPYFKCVYPGYDKAFYRVGWPST